MDDQQLPNIDEPQIAGFVSKTYDILNNQEFNKIVYWGANGKEFVIKDITKFQEIVLPKYFRHRKINSFIRQLNMYGFHKSRKENSKSIFSHPCFLKGREDLLNGILRKPRASDNQPSTPTKHQRIKIQQYRQGSKEQKTPSSFTERINIKSNNSINDLPCRQFLDSKQCLQSRMNLSFNYYAQLNKPSQKSLSEIINDDPNKDECLSIENGIEPQNPQQIDYIKRCQSKTGPNNLEQLKNEIKFENPSYFFLPDKRQ